MKRNNLKDLAEAIHQQSGDALAGERVIAQARDIGKARTVPGTSTHKMQEIVLKKNVLCVIDRSFRFVGGGFTLNVDGESD